LAFDKIPIFKKPNYQPIVSVFSNLILSIYHIFVVKIQRCRDIELTVLNIFAIILNKEESYEDYRQVNQGQRRLYCAYV